MRFYFRLAASLTMVWCVACTETPPQDTSMDSQTSFKTLLSDADDFELVDATFVKIAERTNNWMDATKFTTEERVIMLVWHSSGIIDNGGFQYLFEGTLDGDPHFQLTAEAYNSLGLTRSYNAFVRAFELFPDAVVPHDLDSRLRIYQSVDPILRDEIDTEFFKDGWEKVRERKLAEYIRANANQIGRLIE